MAWRKQREAEHAFFRSAVAPALSADAIRDVRPELDSDGDFVLRFANAQRAYALAVVLPDASNLGWKECHALVDAINIAERGTPIDNDSFLALLDKLRDRYGRVSPPSVQNRRLTGVVYPSPGTFRTTRENTILHLGLSFDKDGDLVFRATTKDQTSYVVCLELYPRGSSLTTLDCKVFVSILRILEPGDHLSKLDFLKFGLLMRTEYNFVTPSVTNDGKKLTVSILASSAKNEREPHPIFLKLIKKMVQENDALSSNSALSCPYPGITYTRALKESGQAQVYAGTNAKGEKVAVKVFSTSDDDEEDAIATYKTELRMLLKMSPHPNVVEVLDFFETPRPAVLMRLVEGEDLMDHLNRHGRCDEATGRKLIVGIAKGLCHLHSHGVIHRDLKTLNILRQNDGTPIIIDLGLGSTLQKGADSTMTMDQLCSTMAAAEISEQTNAIKGTIPWMPPEMITDRKWSEKTDVYAFGIIMWEIFSGKRPFEDKTGVPMLLSIVAGERPPLSAVSHISSELRSLMQACWHGDPKRRPAMKHVLDSLHGNDPRQIFKSIDKDGSGTLDFGEFVMFLQRYIPGQVEPGQMHALFKAIDHDNSGSINFNEFEEFWRRVEKGGLAFSLKSSRGKRLPV